jgi:hypothetical protein
LEYGAGLYGAIPHLPDGIQTAGRLVIGLTIAEQPVTSKTPGFKTAITDLMQLDKALRKRKLPHTWSLLKICIAYQQEPLHPAYQMLLTIKSKLYNLESLTSRCLYELLATPYQPIRESIYHKQVSMPQELVDSLAALEKKGLTFNKKEKEPEASKAATI